MDDALEALGRAAKLDPKNAEVQNYLGLVLSQKGMRKAAESALRKAIALDPNYASAHYNLAVIHATQRPPDLELARFHYKKALAAGLAPNPDMEKLLNNAVEVAP
jgi:tetratricopeptide (TPR) repeat protein